MQGLKDVSTDPLWDEGASAGMLLENENENENENEQERVA